MTLQANDDAILQANDPLAERIEERLTATGRPSVMTPDLMAEICIRIAKGESLRAIARDKHMPGRWTITRHLLENPSFGDHYRRARELGYWEWADEILEIADDGTTDYITKTGRNGHEYEAVDQEHIQRSRLRVDSRKWLLSKLLSKTFGDKVEHDHTGEVQHSVTHGLSAKEKMRRMALFMLEDQIEPDPSTLADVTKSHKPGRNGSTAPISESVSDQPSKD